MVFMMKKLEKQYILGTVTVLDATTRVIARSAKRDIFWMISLILLTVRNVLTAASCAMEKMCKIVMNAYLGIIWTRMTRINARSVICLVPNAKDLIQTNARIVQITIILFLIAKSARSVPTFVPIATVLMTTNAHHARTIIISMRASVWNVTTLVAIALVLRPTNAYHVQNIITSVGASVWNVTNLVPNALVLIMTNAHHVQSTLILIRLV